MINGVPDPAMNATIHQQWRVGAALLTLFRRYYEADGKPRYFPAGEPAVLISARPRG